MSQYIIGSYPDPQQAQAKVRELLDTGFPTKSIVVFGKKSIAEPLKSTGVRVEHDVADNKEGTWDKVRSFFTEKTPPEESGRSSFHDDIQRGNIVVVVNSTLAPNYLVEKLPGLQEQAKNFTSV